MSCSSGSQITHTVITRHVSTIIGVDFRVGTVQSRSMTCKLQIWGDLRQERYRTLSSITYRHTHSVSHLRVLCTVTDEESFTNVERWIEGIGYTV